MLLNDGAEVGRVNGVDPVKLSELTQKLAQKDDSDFEPSGPANQETLNETLHRLTHKSGIVLFMKGIPADPKCKFSRATMELLTNVQSDILENKTFE